MRFYFDHANALLDSSFSQIRRRSEHLASHLVAPCLTVRNWGLRTLLSRQELGTPSQGTSSSSHVARQTCWLLNNLHVTFRRTNAVDPVFGHWVVHDSGEHLDRLNVWVRVSFDNPAHGIFLLGDDELLVRLTSLELFLSKLLRVISHIFQVETKVEWFVGFQKPVPVLLESLHLIHISNHPVPWPDAVVSFFFTLSLCVILSSSIRSGRHRNSSAFNQRSLSLAFPESILCTWLWGSVWSIFKFLFGMLVLSRVLYHFVYILQREHTLFAIIEKIIIHWNVV